MNLTKLGHHIDNIAEIDTIVGTPWEEVGFPITNPNSVAQTLIDAKLDWGVIKRPAWVETTKSGMFDEELLVKGGAKELPFLPVKVPGNYVLLRDDTMAPISPFVGPRWKPIQNADAFEVFRDFCEAGNMQMETAGSLFEGQHIWGLARIQGDYELSDGERISGYFLLMQSHVYGSALRALFTPIRFPGGYTMVQAVNRNAKIKKTYTMPHSRYFNASRVAEIKEVMGMAQRVLADYVDDAKRLSTKLVSDRETILYFIKIFHPDLYTRVQAGLTSIPERISDLRTWDESNRNLKKVPDYLSGFAGANMASCSGTAWGLVQATTHAFDNIIGQTPDTRLVNSWMGPNAKKKLKALHDAMVL